MGSKKVSIVVALLMLLPLLSSAQNLKIVGKTNRPNALVRLLTYDDMFTREQTTIDETRSDIVGNFSFNTVIQQVTPVQIAVGLDRVDLVLRPGGFYDIVITIHERDAEQSYFEREPPSLTINESRDNDMSRQLITAEAVIADFVYDHVDEICRARKSYLIDTLANMVDRNFGDSENTYSDDFVRYKLASLRLVASMGNSSKIITQYFDSQPVLYSQSSYVELFDDVFKNYFQSHGFSHGGLVGALYSGYGGFRDYVMEDDFLSRNPQLAEMVILKYLSQVYYGRPEMRPLVLGLMEAMADGSCYPENRDVAANMVRRVSRLAYDTEAPSFSLCDRDGDTVRLLDLSGGMVLLQFVDRVSTMSDYEFSRLKELHDQWQDTISVVTISVSEAFDDFVQLFENKGYKWQLLNLGDDILLLEKYNVRTCPDYVILKSGGRIGMAPAATPDRYLDYHVRRIYSYK